MALSRLFGRLNRVYAFVKKWLLDGWLTEGPQIAVDAGHVKMFARCHKCRRVWPHWWSNCTAEEFKAEKRRRLGCPCGSLQLSPCILPAWQSVWWFVVRGWLIRKVVLHARMWDPRMPVRL